MNFSRIIVFVAIVLTLTFSTIETVLMCVSPVRYYAFWKWTSSFVAGSTVQKIPPGRHLKIRITGFLSTAMLAVIWLGMINKILNPNIAQMPSRENAQPVVSGASRAAGEWSGIAVSIVIIAFGVYALLRTESLERRLESAGVPRSPDKATNLRGNRLIGIGFIIAGGFCLFGVARMSLL